MASGLIQLKLIVLFKGKSIFEENPFWTIDGTVLPVTSEINYLGVTLSNKSGNSNSFSRLRSCCRAFYSLQGSGFCKEGLETNYLVEIWNKCCSPVLTYGSETVNMSKTNKQNISKLQTRLLKTELGIKQSGGRFMCRKCNRYY